MADVNNSTGKRLDQYHALVAQMDAVVAAYGADDPVAIITGTDKSVPEVKVQVDKSLPQDEKAGLQALNKNLEFFSAGHAKPMEIFRKALERPANTGGGYPRPDPETVEGIAIGTVAVGGILLAIAFPPAAVVLAGGAVYSCAPSNEEKKDSASPAREERVSNPVRAPKKVGVCGDGVREDGEQCDDGNRKDRDGCSADCRSNETCGNGVRDVLKVRFDPTNANKSGRLFEACDDGNNINGDGCSSNCESEEMCGNGIVDKLAEEICDDGNNFNHDGCSSDCKEAAACGNGTVERLAGNERCDDGNTVSGDGCSSNCISAEGCGNGIVDKYEVCDDGNNVDGDGCSSGCESNETCGNGRLDTAKGESCDDGNTVSGDGCSAHCGSKETCGNGIVDYAKHEVCDDGNNVSGDGCSANCGSKEVCGNGITDYAAQEKCDDGNNINGDGCSSGCESNEICGNLMIDFAKHEICDDGNTISGDGCSADCKSDETCGNGIVDIAKGEKCDGKKDSDGKDISTCNDACKTPLYPPLPKALKDYADKKTYRTAYISGDNVNVRNSSGDIITTFEIGTEVYVSSYNIKWSNWDVIGAEVYMIVELYGSGAEYRVATQYVSFSKAEVDKEIARREEEDHYYVYDPPKSDFSTNPYTSTSTGNNYSIRPPNAMEFYQGWKNPAENLKPIYLPPNPNVYMNRYR